jgi:hypothetical protein
LQDSLKEHRPFGDGSITVFFRKAHHCVLNNVQRRFLVPHCEHRLFEGASLYSGKEVR